MFKIEKKNQFQTHSIPTIVNDISIQIINEATKKLNKITNRIRILNEDSSIKLGFQCREFDITRDYARPKSII